MIILSYLIFFYLIGVAGNLLVVYSIPREYFQHKGIDKDLGYKVSLVFPFLIFLTSAYFFIEGFIKQARFRVKIWYYKWKLRRLVGKIVEDENLDMDDIIDQIDNLNKNDEV